MSCYLLRYIGNSPWLFQKQRPQQIKQIKSCLQIWSGLNRRAQIWSVWSDLSNVQMWLGRSMRIRIVVCVPMQQYDYYSFSASFAWSALYQCFKQLMASITSSLSRFRSLKINLLVKENIRSHSADINGIDSKSNVIFKSRGYSSRRTPHHSNGRLHDIRSRRQYSTYSSRIIMVS